MTDGYQPVIDAAIPTIKLIFDDLFAQGIVQSQDQAIKLFQRLVKGIDIPLKYNKELLDQIANVSVFNGHFAGRYTTREINKLKKAILKAKYSNMSEEETKNLVMSQFNTTKKSAQLIARTEIQRLRETTNMIYYNIPEIKDGYERVWETREDGKVRETHQAMDGKVARESDGKFYSASEGWIDGPGSGSIKFAINCRCRTRLRKKK